MKRVAVFSGDEIIDVTVPPGATARDVLIGAGLPSDYFLSPRDGDKFGDAELVYPRIVDGDKLHASVKATVGGEG